MKALVIVDMLDDFVTGELANPDAERIIEPVARLLEHARSDAGYVVVFSNDAHDPSDPELRVWGAHALAGTPGAQVIAELEPHPGPREIVSPKRAYGAFDGTDLDERLQALAVDEVVITGSSTFGSGCRYGEWTGVAFAVVEPETGRPATPPDQISSKGENSFQRSSPRT